MKRLKAPQGPPKEKLKKKGRVMEKDIPLYYFDKKCLSCKNLLHIGFWGESKDCPHCSKHKQVVWIKGQCNLYQARELTKS